MEAAGERPSAPILDVDESKDLKVFYHNVAYKTNRVVINLEKMKVCCGSMGCDAIAGSAPALQLCPGIVLLMNLPCCRCEDLEGQAWRMRQSRRCQLHRQV